MKNALRSGRILATSFLVSLAGLSVGCSQTTAPALAKAPVQTTGTPAPPGGASATLQVPAIVVSPFSDAELAAQFEHGRALLLAENYKESAEVFDRLVRLAPDGEVAAPSLFNSAVAHEGLSERDVAVSRLEALLAKFPNHATARGALFRLAHLYGYLERWPDLAKVADPILALPDLSVMESIGAHGMKALGLVEQDDVDQALRQVNTARDMVEEHRLGEAGKPPIELAEVSFALGEIRRKKSERLTFTPMPPNFPEVLEQRCQGLLDAQNAYADAMRSYDAHWSAMAGYRVGQLYQQLHRDVMQVPVSAKIDTPRKKQLFEGAMRLRYRVLLEKGLDLMNGTVRLGDRTGEDSAWVHRARDAKRDLELALEEEKAAMGKLPFTEAELTAALEQLKKPKP